MSGTERKSRVLAYVLAATFVAGALTLKVGLSSWVPIAHDSPFLLVPAAVMLAAWHGGIGPGLFATVLGAAAVEILFLVPGQHPRLAELLRLGMFVLEGVLISLLAQALHVQVRRADRAVREAEASAARLKELTADLERRVDERTEALREANRELESFSYSVSHDLRAPLRHIDGFSQLLKRHLGDKVDERTAHYLSVLESTARMAGMLVDDLLSFSRMGRIEMRRAEADMNALVSEARREAEAEAEAQERRIDWVVGDLPAVQGDPAMLRLVWKNLLQNAVKFTRHQDPARIEIGTHVNGSSEIEFFVRDNGAGFDPRFADKLFGVFQRLHRNDEFEGTGIGLANVRRIVGRHGGRCWAEGTPGRGAVIHFTLPWRRAA